MSDEKIVGKFKIKYEKVVVEEIEIEIQDGDYDDDSAFPDDEFYNIIYSNIENKNGKRISEYDTSIIETEPIDWGMEVSNMIESILNKKDINQKQLAHVLGITKVHLNYLYNGNRNASKTLLKLLRIINKYPHMLKDDYETS